VGQLPRAAVLADLAGEDAAPPLHEVGLPPRLVEERQNEDPPAVADRHLEDAPAAGAHRPLGDAQDLGDDRHRLVHLQLAQGGELAAARVAARHVREQVADRRHAERLAERLRAAVAEHRDELRVEGAGHGHYGSRARRRITDCP